MIPTNRKSITKLINRFITLWLDEQGNFAGISFHFRTPKKCSMPIKINEYQIVKKALKKERE
jgi:hypothetical protein